MKRRPTRQSLRALRAPASATARGGGSDAIQRRRRERRSPRRPRRSTTARSRAARGRRAPGRRSPRAPAGSSRSGSCASARSRGMISGISDDAAGAWIAVTQPCASRSAKYTGDRRVERATPARARCRSTPVDAAARGRRASGDRSDRRACPTARTAATTGMTWTSPTQASTSLSCGALVQLPQHGRADHRAAERVERARADEPEDAPEGSVGHCV